MKLMVVSQETGKSSTKQKHLWVPRYPKAFNVNISNPAIISFFHLVYRAVASRPRLSAGLLYYSVPVLEN